MNPALKTLSVLFILLNLTGCDLLGPEDENLPPLKKQAEGDNVENLNKISLVDQALANGDEKDQYIPVQQSINFLEAEHKDITLMVQQTSKSRRARNAPIPQ